MNSRIKVVIRFRVYAEKFSIQFFIKSVVGKEEVFSNVKQDFKQNEIKKQVLQNANFILTNQNQNVARKMKNDFGDIDFTINTTLEQEPIKIGDISSSITYNQPSSSNVSFVLSRFKQKAYF